MSTTIMASVVLLFYAEEYVHGGATPVIQMNSTDDMLSLLQFRQAITSDPGGFFSSWNSSIDYCNWKSITCGRRHPGRVVKLDLSAQSLGGRIPPSLENLTFLRVINLSSNTFFGQLPVLNRLHKLGILDLSNNQLQRLPPDALRNCSNLLYLDLSNNTLAGSIPASLGNTSNLLLIDFSSNSFIGHIPSSLGKLSALEYLVLDQNKLEANDGKGWEFLDALGNCSRLKWLGLSQNQLQGSIPNSIGKLSGSLEYLLLERNNLSGTVPESIGNLENLTYLVLGENNLAGPIGSWVGKLEKLERLNLSSNNFNWL